MVGRVQIVTELKGAQQVNAALNQWNTGLQRVGQTAANTNRQATQLQRGAAGVANIIRFSVVPALTAWIGVAGAREFVRIADTYRLIESRLSLVTRTTSELTSVQRGLFDISQRTRISFEATAELFTRVARSSAQLGISNQRLLAVTETINQALIVSGASAQEAQAGLIQFAQGLASGALRGDELRSVLEQLPRLAQAIADGLGITVGRLRELGAEGKLSAIEVIEAIESQAAAIGREFGGIETTVGQALETLGNAFGLFISRVDKAIGSSESFRTVIELLRDVVEGAAERMDQSLVKELTNVNAEVVKTRESIALMRRELEQFGGSSPNIEENITRAEERLAELLQRSAELTRRLAQERAEAVAAEAEAAEKAAARATELTDKEIAEIQRKADAASRLRLQEIELQERIGAITLEAKIQQLQAEVDAENISAQQRLRIESQIARAFQDFARDRLDLLRMETDIEARELRARLGNTARFIEEKKRLLADLVADQERLARDLESRSELAGAAVRDVRDEIRDTEAEGRGTFASLSQRMREMGTVATGVQQGLRSGFSSAFGQITRGGFTMANAIRSVFTSIADSILQQFARVAADRVFRVLFGDLGSSGSLGSARAQGRGIVSGGGLLGGGAGGNAVGPSGLLGGNAASVGAAAATLALPAISRFLGDIFGDLFGGGDSLFTALFGGVGALFQTGGERIVTRPTLIGVGEVGPERVQVTPLANGRRGTGGMTLVFQGPTILDDASFPQFERMVERAVARGNRRIV